MKTKFVAAKQPKNKKSITKRKAPRDGGKRLAGRRNTRQVEKPESREAHQD